MDSASQRQVSSAQTSIYYSLQACRAIAALLVMLYHLGGIMSLPKYFGVDIFGGLFSFGDSGVQFFFVLSGYIIFTVHKKDINCPKMLGQFALKRAARIYPTYWLVFFGVLLLSSVFIKGGEQAPHTFSEILLSLLLLPRDVSIIGGTGAPVIMVAWTLQYEMLFYACFAAAILNRWVGVAVFVAVAACGILAPPGAEFPISFIRRQEMFLFYFGIAAAMLASTFVGRFGRPVFVGGIFLYLSIAAKALILGAGAHRDVLGYGVASVLIVCGLVGMESRGTVLGKSAPVQMLGAASYALYLLHVPIISICMKLSKAAGLESYAGAAVATLGSIAACVGVSILTHLKIERPLLGILHRSVFRRETTPSPA